MTPVQIKSIESRGEKLQAAFTYLAKVSDALNQVETENAGRDLLIRALEYEDVFDEVKDILLELKQRAGLYPYMDEDLLKSPRNQLAYEFHRPIGLENIVFHSIQAKVYRILLEGENLILSAPTSFGKSLIVDSLIAINRFNNVVIIVPSIALMDETRQRLTSRFGKTYKIITHASQSVSEKNIFVFTQERFLETRLTINPDLFVIDEFYKLSMVDGDERTLTLNHAFYKLIKTGAQFFLIGPNIQNVNLGDSHEISFKFIRTDFTTVSVEIIDRRNSRNQELDATEIAKTLFEPTLIFCQSAGSAKSLANEFVVAKISHKTKKCEEFSGWVKANYHDEWDLAMLLEHGIAIHHASLPRAIAYHILRFFNEGHIRFLFCTSTIIEGVNTSAKNIIIYDNKIANKKFNYFTFNNIKGRSGRMFKHYVGRVFLLNPDPQQELPIVEVPSLVQAEGTPESLIIQLEPEDLTPHSEEKLKYLHAQDFLKIETIKSNIGIAPNYQISLAQKISSDLKKYHSLLNWRTYPTAAQLKSLCEMIFVDFLNNKGRDEAFTYKQLAYKIESVRQAKDISEIIDAEVVSEFNKGKTVSSIIESWLLFFRRWGEYHFPKYAGAIDNIQREVFSRHSLPPGDFSLFIQQIKQLSMPLCATVLEEYGIPYQITLKINEKSELGQSIDSIIDAIRLVNVDEVNLSDFEKEIALSIIKNI